MKIYILKLMKNIVGTHNSVGRILVPIAPLVSEIQGGSNLSCITVCQFLTTCRRTRGARPALAQGSVAPVRGHCLRLGQHGIVDLKKNIYLF